MGNNRTALFVNHQPGGLFSVEDVAQHPKNIWFVDSAAAGAGDTVGHGKSPDTPFATLGYAFSSDLVAAGDVVYVLPGHTQTLAASITMDIAGVKVVGLGWGNKRPTLVGGAIDYITMTAADVEVEGLVFTTPTGAGVFVNIAAARCAVRRCRFNQGANSANAITVTADGELPEISGNEVIVSADGPSAWVLFEGVVDRPLIFGNNVIGSDGANAYDQGVLDFNTVAVTNALVWGNRFTGAGVATTVMANVGALVGNVFGSNVYGGSAVNADNASDESTVLVELSGAAGVAAWPAGAAAANGVSIAEALRYAQENIISAGGTVLPAAQSIYDLIAGANGIAAWAAGAAPANGVSLSEAVRDIWDVLRNGTGGSEPGVNRSIIDCIRGAALNYGNTSYLAVTADMTQAAWQTAATHEVFTVTGAVRMRILVECTGTLTDAGDLAVIQMGIEGATAGFIAATDAAGKNANTIETGEIWCDNTPADTYGNFSSLVLDKVVSNSLDVGYEITGQQLTGGSLVFHCWWEPLNSTGAVVAGAGAAL